MTRHWRYLVEDFPVSFKSHIALSRGGYLLLFDLEPNGIRFGWLPLQAGRGCLKKPRPTEWITLGFVSTYARAHRSLQDRNVNQKCIMRDDFGRRIEHYRSRSTIRSRETTFLSSKLSSFVDVDARVIPRGCVIIRKDVTFQYSRAQ